MLVQAPSQCVWLPLSAFCNPQPGVTSQISVQTEQELFEQMHFFDDPFSSCCRRTLRFECRMNGVERRQY